MLELVVFDYPVIIEFFRLGQAIESGPVFFEGAKTEAAGEGEGPGHGYEPALKPCILSLLFEDHGVIGRVE